MTEFERLAAVLDLAVAHTHGTHTIEDIQQMVEEERLQFWPGRDSAVVTEILQYPRAKALHIFLAAGNMEELQGMLEPLENFAREQGCDRITMAGRAGWARSFMKDRGFRPKYVVMVKDV